MTDPTRPISDPTHPKVLEGDEVPKPPLADGVAGRTSAVGPDGDPRPVPGADDPEGADD